MNLSKRELITIENALCVYKIIINDRLKNVKENVGLYSEDYLLFLENEILYTKDLLKII